MRYVVQQPKAVQLSVQLFSVSSEIGVHKIFSRCIVLLFSAESSILDFYRLALTGVVGILGAYSTAVAIWRLLPADISQPVTSSMRGCCLAGPARLEAARCQ